MKTVKVLALVAVSAALLTVASVAAAADKDEKAKPAGLKKMIAVVAFENKTDRSRWWWTGPDPGQGMSDMLTTALVKSGEFSVFEREQLDKVIAEQNLGQSGRVTQETAPAIGKLLGVTAIVYGTVSEFGYLASETGGGIGGIGAGFSKTTARVSIDELVEKITKTLESVPWSGRVVKAEATRIYLNAGMTAGIQSGMTFNVYRRGEELVDPATGLSLGAEEELVGSVAASEVKEKYSICTVVSGSGFQAGDAVRFE